MLDQYDDEVTLVKIDAEHGYQSCSQMGVELCDMIKKTDIFSGFSDEEIVVLSTYAHAYDVKKGKPVLREGDVDCYMCLVIQGKVDIFRECGQYRVKISSVTDGCTIGEMSLIDGLPNSATAIAAMDTSIILFSKKLFLSLAHEHPELGLLLIWKLAELLSLRLRRTSSLLVDSTIDRDDLKKSRDKALNSVRGKEKFLSSLAHELRNPLNVILGYGSLLQDIQEDEDNEDSEANQHLESILSASHHLVSLINDSLDLSKAESGKMELYKTPFDLHQFLTQVSKDYQQEAKVNHNEILFESPLTTLPVMMDKTKMRQILFNLMGNACKFTQKGSITVFMTVLDDNDKKIIQIKVSDSGIGMNEKQLEKIFQAYVQADASTSANYGGTGLGLAICQRLVGVMSGEIEVSSQLGEGTTFELLFPLEEPFSA